MTVNSFSKSGSGVSPLDKQSRDGSATSLRAHQLFGDQLPKLLDELNQVLAA